MITPQKKVWSDSEDQIIKRLYEVQGQTSWSTIAKILAVNHGFRRKSAKQCRERYQNHISSQGIRVEWTPEQEMKLIQLHNQTGNKWALIAKGIPGKSDNCVKNHFYSKLRKILRKLNSIIHKHMRRQYRPIEIGTLYKIIEATQQRFKEQPACGYPVSIACQELQNRMLKVSMLREEEYDSDERIKIYSGIVRDINIASKLYKRKSKKIRNSAIQAPNTRKKKIREATIIFKDNLDKGYQRDPSSTSQDRKQQNNRSNLKLKEDLKEQLKEQPIVNVVVKEQQSGIRDLLKDAGILKQEQSIGERSCIRFSSRSSFKSYSQNNNVQSDNQFFDDSDNEKGFGMIKENFFNYRGALFDDASSYSQRQAFV